MLFCSIHRANIGLDLIQRPQYLRMLLKLPFLNITPKAPCLPQGSIWKTFYTTDLIKINLTNCAKFSTIRIVKKVIWDSVAKKAVRAFTIDVKREIGALLLSLQRGELLSMPQSRSMKSVHKSAFEFRVKDQSGIYRVFYVLFDGDKINPSCLYEKDSKDATKRN